MENNLIPIAKYIQNPKYMRRKKITIFIDNNWEM